MPVKRKKKKQQPIKIANRVDLIFFIHSNHNGLLPAEALAYMQEYIEKEQIPIYQTTNYCKTFLNQFIGAWGLHLSHVFSPVQSMTRRKGKDIYIPPSVILKRSLKQFFKEIYASSKSSKQGKGDVSCVNEPTLPVGEIKETSPTKIR